MTNVSIPDADPPEGGDLYTQRLVRSVAHNIGNAVNVLSGRLSLLEMDQGLSQEGLEMIALMRDRLRRTQGELRGVVRFFSETMDSGATATPVVHELVVGAIVDLEEHFGPIRGKAEILDHEKARRCYSSYPLRVPLTTLVGGVRQLLAQGEDVSWGLDAKAEGLVFELTTTPNVLPSDRRAVMEPWFEPAALDLPAPIRRGRLDVAVALGRLETGGAHVSSASTSDGERLVSLVRVMWSYI